MEREANYTAVGAFVLVVAALAGAFVYWYSDARNARSYERHEIYFEGSVSGLTVGSTVRYLGVDVGRVTDVHERRKMAWDRHRPVRIQAFSGFFAPRARWPMSLRYCIPAKRMLLTIS